MPRRAASVRHHDSAPEPKVAWPPQGPDLLDALVALHHPTRRRLFELLSMEGPAPVGTLSERTGIAPGSVSHHLKPLHRAGFVEPAPELARDTRESWWRAIDRSLTWSRDAYPPGTAGRHVASLASEVNIAHQDAATAEWMRSRDRLPAPWRGVDHVQDSYVRATPAEVEEVGNRLRQVLRDWREACLAAEAAEADDSVASGRRPVRVITRVFPSDPAPRPVTGPGPQPSAGSGPTEPAPTGRAPAGRAPAPTGQAPSATRGSRS